LTSPDTLIHWLLDNKLAKTFVHKGSQEQLVEITEFGIEINTILDKLKTTSDEAKQTNQILENSKIGSVSSLSKKDFSVLDYLNKKDEVMSPEERCYKILQDSKYIRIPEEDPAQIIESFLKSADQCSWEYPQGEIQERQFETSFKNWFSQFGEEMIQLAKNNPATMDGQSAPFSDIGLHTMDDQGFEGQIMSDGSYWRIIEDELVYIYYGITDEQLESRWQAQATMIQMALTKAYDDSTSKEESDEMFKKAEEAQKKQESVQAEITRRSK